MSVIESEIPFGIYSWELADRASCAEIDTLRLGDDREGYSDGF